MMPMGVLVLAAVFTGYYTKAKHGSSSLQFSIFLSIDIEGIHTALVKGKVI